MVESGFLLCILTICRSFDMSLMQEGGMTREVGFLLKDSFHSTSAFKLYSSGSTRPAALFAQQYPKTLRTVRKTQ